ncbi:Sulfite reductase [NADPH] hemoprotein beta-component [Rosistilla oblonga]|uniref:Sulfite reductase [NADPH] hemoprotein beta-component n=2 Tax=Rosistilla oblonga TaxID=2527990 RepID=A0A518IPT5_9BACT|nr:Sulfite reductase [NADPH] hemoprotein beta-component [Rosistilla oblonga]
MTGRLRWGITTFMSTHSPDPTTTSKPKLTRDEQIKADSQYLAGEIAQELADESPSFGTETLKLLKFHGTYQQDDRDQRSVLRKLGKEKAFSMMVRCRIPGGRLTPRQFLAHLDICDLLGNSTMKITTRQTIQLHGVVRRDLQQTIRKINAIGLSTLAACGDVNRNVMCCPRKLNDPVHRELQRLADALAVSLAPQTSAYHELWVTDVQTGERMFASHTPSDPSGDESDGGAEATSNVEPLYGPTYLPRKFKCGIALPADNCIDIYTQDLGFLAVVRDGRVIGYNVLVGGGMGTTPSQKKTYPAVAKRMAFCTAEQAVDVAKAVLIVQRDNGDRSDRKVARMKYLVDRWGIETFRQHVQRLLNFPLGDCTEDDVQDVDDHMGWQAQDDGLFSYGLSIENGRVKDQAAKQLKTGLREIVSYLGTEVRLAGNQSLIFCDIRPDQRQRIAEILVANGIRPTEEVSMARRYAMACVALPSCGLAITEAERRLPRLIDDLERELARLGLCAKRFTIRMTGCPNGCARPYVADIGLVGKAVDRYTIYVGGTLLGTRLAFIYRDMVAASDLVPQLVQLFTAYKHHASDGESFGDFCNRFGDGLAAIVDDTAARLTVDGPTSI